MTYLIIGILVLIAVALIYLATIDGSYEVKRSKRVNADKQTVYDKLRDFKSWPDWSPWLMHEPEAKLVFSDHFSDVGGFYTWDGQHVGAGKLSHIQLDQPSRIQQRLEFTRPFKSVCDVDFEIIEVNNQAEITWTMRGRMPFLFRFMAKKTAEMIGKDYELGLAMLAGKLDSEAEFPGLSFDGEQTRQSQTALCQSFSGEVSEMETAMRAGYPALVEYIKTNNGVITDAPLAVYHKVDLKTMYFDCDFAVPVKEGLDPGNYQIKQLPVGRFFKITLHGSYEFLELAWYSAYCHLRMHKIKHAKNRPSMEVYITDPETVNSTNQLVTELYIPLK